jgi:dissimilatory sulfite reductase (desulfoviridin) alpha/beta subunit
MKTISTEELRALKAQAMMVEKGGERFSVRVGVTGGHLDATHLETIAALARQLGTGCVHLTTRQGVEISHVPYENLEPLRCALAEAGLKLAPAGRCVRSTTACPGGSCPRGIIDSQAVAQRLHARVGMRDGLPHKFKIAVSGCPNGCTKPLENDLGIMGRGKRFAIFVGGKMGKQPRPADPLSLEISEEDHLFRVVESAIDWYAANGSGGERFGTTIDRVGLDSLVKHLGDK